MLRAWGQYGRRSISFLWRPAGRGLSDSPSRGWSKPSIACATVSFNTAIVARAGGRPTFAIRGTDTASKHFSSGPPKRPWTTPVGHQARAKKVLVPVEAADGIIEAETRRLHAIERSRRLHEAQESETRIAKSLEKVSSETREEAIKKDVDSCKLRASRHERTIVLSADLARWLLAEPNIFYTGQPPQGNFGLRTLPEVVSLFSVWRHATGRSRSH
jgi:hypothetical protein